jgi:SAM-dependent methyltransferase
MMKQRDCRICKQRVNLKDPKCECQDGLPDLRRRLGVTDSHGHIYDQIAADDLALPMQPAETKMAKAARDAKRLGPYMNTLKTSRILEIGPGDGYLLRILSDFGETVAVDVTKNYLTQLTFADHRVVAEVEDLPFEDDFDTIVLCDVLEHVLNEGDALLSLNRALKIGGVLYIRCPANEPLISYATLCGSPYPYVHLRTYSPKDLERSVSFAGFQVLRSGYAEHTPIGFARRSFGLRKLRQARYLRHARESLQAGGKLTHVDLSGLDLLVTRIEAASWHLASKLPFGLKMKPFLSFIWYRGCESFIVARKTESLI